MNNEFEMRSDRLLVQPQELYTALEETMEELRLIRMKDTASVYDPTLRARNNILLAKYAADHK